jgi:hypothetical protein
MPKAKRVPDEQATPYATTADFGLIFDQDMNSLHLLSFLLTADEEKAEQCFVAGLEDSVTGNRVFKEWARTWARRAIIKNAVRMMNPRPLKENGGSNSGSWNHPETTLPAAPVELAPVLELAPFDRFVFVLSVLERYADHDCSLLLGCSRRDVLAARARGLQQIASAVESHREQQINTGSENPVLHDDHSPVFELQTSH